jgi:CHAD domain-containing protein
MALDFNSVQGHFRKLRKSIQGIRESPMPDDVHALRTQTRHVEAILLAFQLERKAVGSELLKSLKPIRKAAGDVRDMDVLIGFSSSLERAVDDQCLVQLLEFLARHRAKSAAKLHKAVVDRRHEARKSLRRCIRHIEDAVSSSKTSLSDGRKMSTNSMSVSFQLEAELANWPKLTEKNIHPFRLKVKILRYILQLAKDSNSKFIKALGKVKDQIGAWHDWIELATIAKNAFRHRDECVLNRQIQQRTKTEFIKALKVANAMRARYFNEESARHPGKKSPPRLRASVISATSRLGV